jgi:hypothetical protein
MIGDRLPLKYGTRIEVDNHGFVRRCSGRIRVNLHHQKRFHAFN